MTEDTNREIHTKTPIGKQDMDDVSSLKEAIVDLLRKESESEQQQREEKQELSTYREAQVKTPFKNDANDSSIEDAPVEIEMKEIDTPKK